MGWAGWTPGNPFFHAIERDARQARDRRLRLSQEFTGISAACTTWRLGSVGLWLFRVK